MFFLAKLIKFKMNRSELLPFILKSVRSSNVVVPSNNSQVFEPTCKLESDEDEREEELLKNLRE